MTGESDLLDFNFWPSFADSMLAVALILVIILVFVAQHGLVGLPSIRESQQEVVQSIANEYNGGAIDTLSQGSTQSTYVIRRKGDPELEIRENLQLQRITFRGNVLFPQNGYQLTKRGRNILGFVGEAIRPRMDSLNQIQIEGHTDTYPTDRYAEGNLELGALRAISVFRFLAEEGGINPARHLMSVTSYGPYKPVDRSPGELYNEDKLWEANDDSTERRRNRRIELLLFYEGAERDTVATGPSTQSVQSKP